MRSSLPSAAALAALLVASLVGPAVPGAAAPTAAFIVGYHDPGDVPAVGDVVKGARVVRTDAALAFAVVETSAPAHVVAALAANPAVRYVEPDPVLTFVTHEPDDARWSDQYGPRQVRAPEAWDTWKGSTARNVCVVDTGVRYTHEDLKGSRWLGGYNFVRGTTDPWDDNGHGTHVAGTAVATMDNGRGIAGVAQVGLLGVKALDWRGSGTFSDIASAVRWCAENDGHVISLSLGATSASTALSDAITYAWGKGSLIVAATGNDGCDDCVLYPASHPRVIAVTCTDETRAVCSFSNSGPEAEIAAPGDAILSTWASGNTAYRTMSGTSMSVPHVSGAAALAWSRNPDLTNADVRALIRDTAQDAGPDGWDRAYGHGILDAAAMLAADGGNGDTGGGDDAPPESVVHATDFDGGSAPGWRLDGLWHVTDACETPPSAPHYLGYHRGDRCTYDTGGRTSGAAAFDVDLSKATRATLRFSHRWATESYASGAYDVMRVQASGNGGSSWTTLAEWDSRDANAGDWRAVSLDLAAFAGGAVTLRFHFDTKDGYANDHPGWFVDDVRVTADVPGGGDANTSPSAAFSVSCDGVTCTFDASDSADPDGSIAGYAWDFGDGATGSGRVVQHAYTRTGTYRVALTVTDDAGATAHAARDVTVTGGPVVAYAEDFDGGSAPGWHTGGSRNLWHMDSACVTGVHGSHRLAFTRASPTCDYDAGRVNGWARSPVVDLSAYGEATLHVTHRWETESYASGAYDVMRIEVSQDGGTSWTTLAEWDSRDANADGWVDASWDVSGFATDAFRLRFVFDSRDSYGNGYMGWFVDRVEVTAE